MAALSVQPNKHDNLIHSTDEQLQAAGNGGNHNWLYQSSWGK